MNFYLCITSTERKEIEMTPITKIFFRTDHSFISMFTIMTVLVEISVNLSFSLYLSHTLTGGRPLSALAESTSSSNADPD